MLDLVLWIGVGALAGSLLGTYHCSDMSLASPKESHALHIGVCAVVGAIAGALQFLVLARFFYGQSPFST
jgi:hypothetical protein